MSVPLERQWDKRVQQWHSHVTSAAAFEKVLAGLLEMAAPQPADVCVDLDAGTGFVTTALAPKVSSGGRLVIADMMFGRGASQRDRHILHQKAVALAAKGPGGWWRIAKNLTRYGLGVGQEHPVTPEFWQAALRDAGFTDVVFQPVVAEAGIVRGIRPPSARAV